jgi:Ammonium Transporter Family
MIVSRLSVGMEVDPLALDPGATAWMLAASALVLLMTPGLAFFYGGLVRMKSVLNIMMMSFGATLSLGFVALPSPRPRAACSSVEASPSSGHSCLLRSSSRRGAA